MAAIGKAPGIGASGKKAANLAGDISSKYPKAGHEDEGKDGAAKKSPAKLRDDLKKKEGPGKPPDPDLRDTLAGPIGGDPGAARFHTGPAAAVAAQELQATAFTIGQDVFFGANKFDPRSRKGIGLIAHESTHVLQQTGAKQNDARFLTPRGGDEMEQEAQDAASVVLNNLGRGEMLQVAEYVRNYSSEGGEAVTFQDRARLDAISRLALKHAQTELRRKGVRDVPPTRELKLDISLDLTELTDQDAAREWGEAIVDAVAALRRPVGAPRKLVQRDTTPAPPAAPPATGPDNPETLVVKVIDPHSGLTAPFTLRHFSNTMEFELRELGVAQVRLLVKILEGAPAIASDGPDADQYGSGVIWLKAVPYENTAKKFYATMPKFKEVAAKLATERTDFLKAFLDQGQKAMLALVKESRARVAEMQKKYGITKTQNTQSSNATTSYSSSNSAELDKISEAAKKLLPKRQRLERLMKSKENLASKLHIAFTSASQLSREEDDVKELPDAQKEWEKEFGEQRNLYPILSHWESASDLESLASGRSMAGQIGIQLDSILTNLNTLEQKLQDATTIFKLDAGFQAIKKSIKPDLTTLQIAYVDMEAEDRRKAEEDLKLYMTLFAVVVGALSGGLGGAALLAAEGVVAGISTIQLIQQINDYTLQDAAHMSDPDLARSLSATEPSLFWLVFDVVSTVVGLRANIGRMRQAVDEIRSAYKLAMAYGDAAELEKVLTAHNVPAETSKKIINTIYHAGTTIANFIRNPDPITAFGVINLFGSFYSLRTAIFKGHAEPAVLTKAKQTLQEARVKAVREVLDGIKAKYPLVTIEIVDQGFDHPVHVVFGSTEIPASKLLRPQAAAGGQGGGKPPVSVSVMAPASEPGGGGGSGPKTLKGLGTPQPHAQSGHTLKGVGPQTGGTLPGPGPQTGGTKKGGAKMPDGVYSVTEGAGKGKTGPPTPQGAHDPATAKTAPQGTENSKTVPAGALGDDKTAKQGTPAPAPPAPAAPPAAPAGPGGTPNNAPQLKGAVEEATAKKIDFDLNIMDPSAAEHTYGGIYWDEKTQSWQDEKSKVAPVGPIPDEGVDQREYDRARKARELAAARNIPAYQAQWIRLPEGRFTMEPFKGGGSSIKFLLVDTVTKQKYLFKPAAGEMPLTEWQHGADGGTLFVRGTFAAMLAHQDLSAMAGNLPFTAVVVHDGAVGSLQPFIEGSRNLLDLKAGITPQDKALYKKVMGQDPGFTRFREDLRAFDHIINNTDRDANDGNIMVHEDKETGKVTYYAIDQDASLAPGAKEAMDPRTKLVRTDLNDPFVGNKALIGKISYPLFLQMENLVANAESAKIQWKKALGINDAAVEGVIARLKEVVADYQDRLQKSNGDKAAVFTMDPPPKPEGGAPKGGP